MASNNPPDPSASGTSVPDNVTIRIITLDHGDRAEDDLYLVLNLNTTVGALKERIQDGLSQRPAPDTQRLLYYGRPLLDNQASLRQILRQEQRPGNTTSHVLHLVIRNQGGPNQPAVTQPHVHNQHVQQANDSMPEMPLPPPGMLPGLPDFAHNMIHNSMHMMQHQMQHQRAVEEANRRARGIHNHIHPANMEQAQQIQAGPQPHATQNGRSPPAHGEAPPAIQVTQTPQMLGLPMQGQAVQSDPTQPAPVVQTTRIQETLGPNGERIRTVVNNNSMMFQITGNNLPNPFDRPSSAPGPSPSANSNSANRAGGPNLPNIPIHAQPPQMPAGFPFPPGRQLPLPIPTAPQMFMPPMMHMHPPIVPHGPPMAWLLSSPQGPQGIVFAPGHGFFSTAAPTITVAPQTQPQPTPTLPADHLHSQIQGHSSTTQNDTSGVQDGSNPPPPQPGARPQPLDPAQVQAAAQPPAAGQPPAQQANEDNDLLQFFINRGWLFLRLYMFVFVFSESGTWRRIIMLGSAIIFCLLPRQNPLTDMFNVMRRHFDNLIGPPQIPQRQAQPQGQAEQQQVQGQQNNTQPGNTANATGTTQGQGQGQASTSTTPTPTRTMPTPEETARRLLAQHQDRRNANPVFDVLYRIEQGIALFLASLIPGVGERHVRAHEEARRIVEEDDRRRREETEQQQQQQGQIQNGSADNKSPDAVAVGTSPAAAAATATTSTSGPASGDASSSGVDRTGNADGRQNVRSRAEGGGSSS